MNNKKGEFIRLDSQIRNWITKDGSPGPTGIGGFKAEKNRYHLYISYACPWASRTLIMRKLKGLEDYISFSVVNSFMGEKNWSFHPEKDATIDHLYNVEYLKEIYLKSNPNYNGLITVPVLFDKKTEQIVNNESSEIIRMFNSAFDDIGAKPGDYYPKDLRTDIDKINELIYNNVNNGVYRAGFATSQEAYENGVIKLFETLDILEEKLKDKKYLFGDKLTEADIRLFVTLIRFDPVYHGHFKCNLKMLKDYQNLWRYTKEIYNLKGIKETVNFEHIKKHYYKSHPSINPNRIVPKGPILDYNLN